MKRVVLVCAAHPDDEVLGCGATMARHAAAGDEVHVLLFGRGVLSRGASAADAEPDLASLDAAARAANNTLGVKSLTILDFPDNMMDTVPLLELAKAAEKAVAAVTPDVVYTHDAGDMNVDHVRVHEAVAIACRPVPGQSVRDLFCFEVPSSTGWRPGASFVPSRFVDVSQTLSAKLAALECYHQEMREWPHARSMPAIEHLARWRGASVGVEAAEAFSVGRNIVHKVGVN